MLKYFLLLTGFTIALNSFGGVSTVKDSTGIEKRGGKTYIVHQLEPKETLYSLSKRYGVSVDEIKSANEGELDMGVGKIIYVPLKPVSNPVVHPSNVKTHKVEPKETLYSISKMYKVTIDDLRAVNDDTDLNDLQIGQEIIIPTLNTAATKNTKVSETNKQTLSATHTVEPKETLYSISKKYKVSIDDLKKFNEGTNISDLKVGQVINLTKNIASTQTNVNPPKAVLFKEPVNEVAAEDVPKAKPVEVKVPEAKPLPVPVPAVEIKSANNVPEVKKEGYTKVNESGFVEVYESNSEFHYALHKTAPVGTIIFIENEDRKVYVRVMGKLTDASSGVMMKISKKAFDKISKGESKVKVSCSYIP